MNKITLARLNELKATYPNRPRGWYIRQAREDTREYIGKPNHPKGLTWEEAGFIIKQHFMINPLRLESDVALDDYDTDDERRVVFAESCNRRQITSLLMARPLGRTYEWKWRYDQVIQMLTPDSWVAWLCGPACLEDTVELAVERCAKLGITPDDLAQGATTPRAAWFYLGLIAKSRRYKRKGWPMPFEFSDQTLEVILRRLVTTMGCAPHLAMKYMPDDLIEGVVANTIKEATRTTVRGYVCSDGRLAAECIWYGGDRLTADQVRRLTAVNPTEVAYELQKYGPGANDY